ncbi:MAG: RNA polymerase sigma factor [Caldilineaceae bacterium]
MNENAQILLARQGDEQAWLALVRQYQTIVFRFAWLLLDDADEADDVAQETFIRAFRSLDSFDLERPLRPWLLQIAKHLASNRRRSLRRYVAALGRWLRHQSAELDDPIVHYSQVAVADELRQAVQRLDEADQEVIYLRYFLELSVAESAEALNVAPGTIKSRLSRALNRLRSVVADEYPDLGKEGAQ